MTSGTFEEQVRSGARFEFGKNWKAFLAGLTDDRIREAESALKEILGSDLREKRFLDAGSGSGLSSLAARRLGAQVVSFDYDPDSVACTEELKRRFFPNDPNWKIRRGSVLDADFLRDIGRFDIVYSWGVLHHTGDMWTALERVTIPVRVGGTLFIAIYNDQGTKSRFWKRVKQFYCANAAGKALTCAVFVPLYVTQGAVADFRQRRNPFLRYRTPTARGMSVVRDWFDWLGGLPFEVASPEALIGFFDARGFELVKLKTTTSLGNNQLVFSRTRMANQHSQLSAPGQ